LHTGPRPRRQGRMHAGNLLNCGPGSHTPFRQLHLRLTACTLQVRLVIRHQCSACLVPNSTHVHVCRPSSSHRDWSRPRGVGGLALTALWYHSPMNIKPRCTRRSHHFTPLTSQQPGSGSDGVSYVQMAQHAREAGSMVVTAGSPVVQGLVPTTSHHCLSVGISADWSTASRFYYMEPVAPHLPRCPSH
jgi:hypothetical protein